MHLQDPCHPTMQLSIHVLEIGQCDFLLQNHFIKRDDKESVKQAPVKDAQAKNASDELEMVEVLGDAVGGGIDLQLVVVV